MSEKPSHNHARDRLNESLSATLDGQASELEMRRVLEKLGSDDDLRATARRYQLVGDSIRHETSQFLNIDLSAGIRDRVAQEEVTHQKLDQPLIQPTEKKGNVVSLLDNWWSSMGRVAVAASVAFAVIVGLRNFNQVEEVHTVADVSDQATLTQPLQIARNEYGASGIRAGYSSRQHNTITPEQLAQAQNVASRATRERFRAYALQHAEMSAVQGGQGMLPFARLTSFDTQ
ncbi:sigma-E factor negative regulatory protein [Endozoicomonas montiporae]|nr:sigma-E factor negative regulatory protein [Endozoicomonas montiporae]